MNNSLSPRQQAFARAVRTLTSRRGIPPTLGEIGVELGVSLARAAQLAAACQARGVVTREPRIARSLRVVSSTSSRS
jgi:SOS-response transcriptional repressor LexA